MRLANALTMLRCYASLPGCGDPVEFCYKHPIRPVQVRWEFEQLVSIIRDLQPSTAMEIGTHNGGTLYPLCRLAEPHATIISLDLPKGAFGGGYHPLKLPIYKRFATPSQKLHFVRSDSHAETTLIKIENLLAGRKLDYLFIDGDHSYQGVKQDFEMYSSLVRSGGVIVFHDVAEHERAQDCQVSKFWQQVKSHYRHQEFIENPAQGWAGIGVLYFD